jgi:hypothetical protein
MERAGRDSGYDSCEKRLMRRAAGNAIRTPPDLVLIAHVPFPVLQRAVPVVLAPLDPFSEPEPSTGATIELASGRHVIVIYGLETERLSLHAAWPEAPQSVADFLREAALGAFAIEWVDPRISSPTPVLASEA